MLYFYFESSITLVCIFKYIDLSFQHNIVDLIKEMKEAKHVYAQDLQQHEKEKQQIMNSKLSAKSS